METTVQIKLDSDLVKSLEETTAGQGVSLDQVMSELAHKYLAEARRKRIAQEFEHYKAMHPAIKPTYLGQHVAVYEGQLVDHDTDASKLVARVRERYGHVPILFVQVEELPEPEVVIHSTRIATTHVNAS